MILQRSVLICPCFRLDTYKTVPVWNLSLLTNWEAFGYTEKSIMPAHYTIYHVNWFSLRPKHNRLLQPHVCMKYPGRQTPKVKELKYSTSRTKVLSGLGTWNMSEMSALPKVFVLVDRGYILSHIAPLFCLHVSCIIQHEQNKESQYFVLPSFFSVRSWPILQPLLKLCFRFPQFSFSISLMTYQ